MKAVLFYKYGNIFRDVMHTPLIDWCQVMILQTQNALVKSFIDFLRENFPDGVHECPYEVRNIVQLCE